MLQLANDACRQLAALHRAEVEFIVSHAMGGCSEMSAEERAMNQLAIEKGAPIVSRYAVGELAQVYVTTPADRAFTRLLLSTCGGARCGLQ
jgi:hypothetical protein